MMARPRAMNFLHLPSHHQSCHTEAVPLTKEGNTIDIVVSMGVSVTGPLGKPDEFTVTNIDDVEPYAGGIKIKGKRLSTTLFLEDGNGKELAKIVRSGGKKGIPKAFDICTPRPFHRDQKPDLDDKSNDGFYEYCWAKVSGDKDGDLKLTIDTWSPENGGGYVTTYTSEPYHPHAAAADIYPPIVFKSSDGSNVAFAGAKKLVLAHLWGLLGWYTLLLEWIHV